jgi:GNAT superfamily N-acetyltransferase
VEEGEYLMPQDLEVDERFQGQGIAAAMYDYVKSKGYRIRRGGQQTDAGAGFWGKHRPEQNVWENFADGKGPGRPGDSQRHGIPKGATMAELEKASHSKGRKGQLARWQLNMRRGKKE